MKLHIGKDFNLPSDAITQKIAFLGRTGSGKSYGASKLIEEMLDIKAQVIILDVVGVWWGLRLLADGKTPGYPITIFGGLHGDVPLEYTSGKLVADLLVDKGISIILDLSLFESDNEKTKFASDFADRFFIRKRGSPSPVFIVLEEAQEFIPQNPMGGEKMMLHYFTRLWKLGRNFGIGGCIISQRPQEVNKKALNMTECIFAFQMTGLHERKTMDEWITDKGLDVDLTKDLPKLEVGQAHLWSPQWLKISETIKIGTKKTFDASSTPVIGRHGQERVIAPIDLEKIKKEMQATIERAKSTNPNELKKRIRELELQLKSQKPIVQNQTKEIIKEIEKPVLKDSQIDRLEKLYNKLQDLSMDVGSKLNLCIVYKQDHYEQKKQPVHIVHPTIKKLTITKEFKEKINNQDNHLPPCDQSILSVLVQYPEGRTRSQISHITGYSLKSSGFSNAISRRNIAGHIIKVGDMLQITDSGKEAVGEVEPLPTGEQLRSQWFSKVPPCDSKILQYLCSVYPDFVEREVVSNETGYSLQSSGFANAISRLNILELIEKQGTAIKASDNLFN